MNSNDNIWQILGIEPTDDKAKIQSAYAAKAKVYHPEEFPEEFQELQKAYKAALKYAKGKKKSTAQTLIQEETAYAENLHEETISEETISEESISEETVYVENTHAQTTHEKVRDVEKTKVKIETKNIKIEHKKILKEEQTFYDYEDLTNECDEKECLNDLMKIAINPYIMNNINVWKYMFEQNKYKKWLKDSDSCTRIVKELIRLSGFRKNITTYFEEQLGEIVNDKTVFNKCRRASFIKQHFFKVEKWVTREQKDIHELILSKTKRITGREDLNNKEVYINYINLYLGYADGHYDMLFKNYWTNRYASLRITLFVIISVIAIASGILVTRSLKLDNKSEQEKRVESFEEERIQNLKKNISTE